jgi:2-oxoglutarate/2-oxoacid ferredoxin oxidoreductase subunit alpha
MSRQRRLVLKIAGESGQGINSVGEMVAKAVKETGLYSFGYREYPSLIKGGFACHQVDFADYPLNAPSKYSDLMLCFSRVSFHKYLSTMREGGQIIHMLRQLELSEAEQEIISHKKLVVSHVPAQVIALETSGKPIMANVVLVGVLWRLLGLPIEPLQQVLRAEFADKPDVIEPNLACLEKGYSHQSEGLISLPVRFQFEPERGNDALLTGNHLVALGAIAAGVRAYFAYPMTPSSSILSYLAEKYHDTGMLVKQVDDEISVAQMAIGAMFMGTRALVGTSGGGFDLMTESLSLAAMTETPFVCILGQRPGPATGLPTWTSASDLNLAVYAGHGEFTRCVIAASDPASTYLAVQKGFNIAEKYQIPVIILTDKQIAESLVQVENLPDDLAIERNLVPQDKLSSLTSEDRYAFTPSGVSPRWLPGQSKATFDANSDEHTPDGSLTEEAEPSEAMYAKRLHKEVGLLNDLPEPIILGPESAVLTFVGWGSVRNTVEDVINEWNELYPLQMVNYMHYEFVFPVKTEKLKALIGAGQPLVLIENNAFGQLGALLTQETGYQFVDALLKFDGRPFFIEDVQAYLQQRLGT